MCHAVIFKLTQKINQTVQLHSIAFPCIVVGVDAHFSAALAARCITSPKKSAKQAIPRNEGRWICLWPPGWLPGTPGQICNLQRRPGRASRCGARTLINTLTFKLSAFRSGRGLRNLNTMESSYHGACRGALGLSSQCGAVRPPVVPIFVESRRSPTPFTAGARCRASSKKPYLSIPLHDLAGLALALAMEGWKKARG